MNSPRWPASRLFGVDDSNLVAIAGQALHPQAAQAFLRLQEDAAAAGFELCIASGFRSFERQRRIWNRKLCGEAPVLDDCDCPIDLQPLPIDAQLACVLRFSALPGTSRHHWGTDLDVFDAAAVDADYRLQLSAAEVADGGVFAPLHEWLDERIAGGCSHGFFRPYDQDRGGVAPERWHLSYAPLADACATQLEPGALATFLEGLAPAQRLEYQDAVLQRLPGIFERYVRRVARAPDAAVNYSVRP